MTGQVRYTFLSVRLEVNETIIFINLMKHFEVKGLGILKEQGISFRLLCFMEGKTTLNFMWLLFSEVRQNLSFYPVFLRQYYCDFL